MKEVTKEAVAQIVYYRSKGWDMDFGTHGDVVCLCRHRKGDEAAIHVDGTVIERDVDLINEAWLELQEQVRADYRGIR